MTGPPSRARVDPEAKLTGLSRKGGPASRPAPIESVRRALMASRQTETGTQIGGSARAYLAGSSRCQRSYHHGHPRHDGERGLHIYASHACTENARTCMICG